ncbi:hypothetical protein SAMN04488535_2109 [Corynebacterium mycetoides]|uniref:Beta-N-acetylhexosaminidase n=1 Tax=Corynebacterium mycetoides TaxID=38302 RepID=A0A1G9QV61_9CORY|nr:hypothetical protein [Corynebacterium mycetoides]SDM14899.1 hypothetical protein SAMN04488535_2109 [Corynebacterium mycetoides]
MQRISTSVALIALTALAGLTACSNQGDGEAPETLVTSETSETSVVPATTSTEASTSESSAETTATTATTKPDKDAAAVDVVAERFSTLAPKELFEEFDTCISVDMEGSYDCSGATVGQFQFFDSDAKAASTTQLLTELRSSRVVEDTGDRVVGWSTLGTSAIITVVDNTTGQVMQQLISTDQQDPREKIYELGLAEPEAA